MQLLKGLVPNLLTSAVFLALLIFVAVEYGPMITEIVSEPEEFRAVILSYGSFGALIFIAVQVLQILIAVIPGEVVQIAGGYIYGAWLATLLLLIGAVIGTAAAFGLARLMGYSLVKKLVSQEKLDSFTEMITSRKGYIIIFILFFIPGLPKDFLTYLGGLTPVKPLHFIFIAVCARTPALLFSTIIGENLQERDYSTAVILAAAAVVVFVIGLLYRSAVYNWLQKLGRSRKSEE